ncbi:hypothetical protein FNV43_RR08794 [Rhamnella rubrinervis]|uniref:Leucine-rich repeat-containing N-terminal plant-type domain-containing protein n=1 Tax=Rhamnella rubrinervis TaxID=2594499 RepID=A0A8K0MJ94_9ROSA|nr:hypothetical protein FNV43_RR08794 [Rhamnella rubrinervis]
MTSTPLLSMFLLIISIHSSLFNHVVVSVQCLSYQQSLLLQLKDSLIFDASESTILVKWNQSSDCCSWAGITCEEGHVIGLNLRNESISAGLDENSTLWSLIFLKTLDLSLNVDLPLIPSRIGNLTNLSYLNLSSSFSGQIPKEISRLKKLRILDLSGSFYESSNLRISNLRMLVQNLTELEEFYLDSVNISAPGNEWGQALSSSLHNLRVLSLYKCGLGGPIHQSLAKLQHLSVIRLDNNKLSSLVPRFFGNFSNLSSLQLHGCDLHGTFPKEIFQVPTLRILRISTNGVLEGSLPEFPPNSDLQFFDIRATNFKGRLPSSIGNLRRLTHLYISNCHFSGPLPKSIAKLTQLVHLHLSNNQFVGPISSVHLEGLLKLLSINLHNNSFNGNIPSLFTLPLLEYLDLSHNQFSGQVLEFLNAPSSMLKSIDLSGNKLQGPIPMSIFKLRELEDLTLSFNKFNGTMQLDMIEGLPNLITLDLSYNNLSVNMRGNGSNISFPTGLLNLQLASCNLRKFPYLSHPHALSTLDLSDNQIYGEIPNWIWNVGITGLHGKIPILPPIIYYVDLSSNSFTSSIPSDIGNNLRNAFYFSLSNNSLTGIIPQSICKAGYLKVLDLSNNNLTGTIPTCMFALSYITVKLGRNNLSGPIPDAFRLIAILRPLISMETY